MTKAPLRILIPAYNEFERIEPTLVDYCEYFGGGAVITVIANACTDETIPAIRELMRKYENLELVVINGRVGKGGAIRAGLKTGQEPYVGFADADGSTSAAEFGRLYASCIARGTHGCIGSRWLPGAVVRPRQPLRRRIASRAFNAIARLLFGLPFVDTQCGAKVFKRSAVQTILGGLEVADFAFDIEVLWRLQQNGFRVAEEPTIWADRAAGTTVRLASTSWKMLKTLLRMRLRATVFGSLPFFEYLARESIIPVRSGPSVLVVVPPSFALAPAGERSWFNECVRELRLHGCQVELSTDAVVHKGRWNPLYWLRFWAWYACVSKRKYDALVEIGSGTPSMLLAVSLKRRFLWDAGPSGVFSRFMRRQAYRRVHGVFSPSEPPMLVARRLMERVGAGTLYRAAFHPDEDGWSLRYSDIESGSWTLQTLR